MNAARFWRFSVAVLGFTLLVILWGAYVRASGSGAGCGSHWPLCNGEVIPRPKSLATVIELTHRLTSGLSLILIVIQLFWARRVFTAGHPARRAATAAMVFILTEAAVGAGLVLFEMVAQNASVGRAAWMIAHLGNTFALVAACTLTVWASWPGRAPPAPGRGRVLVPPAFVIALALTLVVGASGAVAALGDTLFPAASLAQGLAADVSPTAHLFVRLRVWHPVLAVVSAIYLLALAAMLASRDLPGVRPLATALAGAVLLQVGAGLLNVVLLAPIPLQIVHLLLADLVWIALVALTATVAAAARGPLRDAAASR